MNLYFAKAFDVTATGGVIKGVACERCGGGFFYQLVRVGAGTASAPYCLGQDLAAADARSRAEGNLAAQLQIDCEAVPCPHCGHIQQEMIDCLRDRAYTPLRVLAWVIPPIGLLITSCAGLVKFANRGQIEPDYTLCIIAAAGFLGLVPLFLGLRRWLLARGQWLQSYVYYAPPALLPAGVDENGQTMFRAVPRA